ncbi:hypothetical protein T12_3948 [Trichinella patagoniensis]|uniref:CCHC-type domain-containing protein n=1 Tax=Trichinella patagoniensis TaxID=990121 RepID=A0A0V0Z2A3_9BILA|nr:hypothetical protein T12_3948 [Trichinella patagoniensis]
MDVQETDDYDGLKWALFEAFEVRTGLERFFTEFFRRKQQRGEGVRVFAGHLRRLFAKAFPEMSGSADKILETDNFTEAVEVAVKEERVVRELTTLRARVASVKTVLELLEPTAGRDTEAAAAAVTTRKEVENDLAEVLRQIKELLTDNTLAGTKRPPPRQRRGPEKRGDRRCWKSGGLGHISRECQASSRDARASEHTVLCVRELSHEILLGWYFMRYHGCTPDPTVGYLRMRQGNIPFLKSHAVAPVRAESPQSELMAHQPAHEAMEKMLSSEQESSGKHRSALAVILRKLADVLSTTDGDPGRTSVVRHAIYTGDAKPVRCSPRRIPYHQRAQQSLGIPYRTCEEKRRVMPVLCRLPADEQPHTEGCPPAPEDPRHFGRAGVCTMVFGPGLGKRILAGWGRITRSGEDGIHHPLWVVPVHSDALWNVQRTSHLSEAHGNIPERPGGLRLLGAPGRCHRIWQDYQRTYGTTTRGVPPPLGSGFERQTREMPAHEEDCGVLGPHHFGKRDPYRRC